MDEPRPVFDDRDDGVGLAYKFSAPLRSGVILKLRAEGICIIIWARRQTYEGMFSSYYCFKCIEFDSSRPARLSEREWPTDIDVLSK